MTVANLRPGLRAFLLGDSAIAADVVDRIYSGQMAQGEMRNSVVFNEVSTVGDHHMEGPSGLVQARYQVDAWSERADDAAALAALVKTRLDGFSGVFAFGSNSPQDQIIVQGVFFQTARDNYDATNKLFGRSQDFVICYAER